MIFGLPIATGLTFCNSLLCSFPAPSSGLLWTAGNGEEEILPHCNLQVFTYTCDVGKRENVYLTAERVRKEVGEVSVLVNNAGVVSGHHLLECPDELIERTMMVNCHAHFWVNINIFVFITGPTRWEGWDGGSPQCQPESHLHTYTIGLPSNSLFPMVSYNICWLLLNRCSPPRPPPPNSEDCFLRGQRTEHFELVWKIAIKITRGSIKPWVCLFYFLSSL